jgi:predicted PhzF superfamily epimerase YddE/YHI9
VQALDVPAGRVEVSQLDGLTTVRARAEWAPEFVFHDLDSPADVDALDPAAFDAGHHYAWAWLGDDAIRSRMFAPDMGIAEDERTGAAAVRITARLQRDLRITQGRGSTLVTAWDPEGWVRLGGHVVADVPIDL